MTRRLLVLLAGTAALTGCSDPYTAQPTPTPTPTPSTTPGGELPGRIPKGDRDRLAQPARAAASSERAIRRHAALTTNWTGKTVAVRYRSAARAAVGQARRDAEQTASVAQTDPQLAGTSSASDIVAIVRQAKGWALVITRERLTPDAAPARYRIYRAHTRRVRDGFAIDAWEPQP